MQSLWKEDLSRKPDVRLGGPECPWRQGGGGREGPAQPGRLPLRPETLTSTEAKGSISEPLRKAGAWATPGAQWGVTWPQELCAPSSAGSGFTLALRQAGLG